MWEGRMDSSLRTTREARLEKFPQDWAVIGVYRSGIAGIAPVWFTRAAERGCNKAITLRETLEGVMIPEQLPKAQQLEAQGFRVRSGADSRGSAAQGVNRE